MKGDVYRLRAKRMQTRMKKATRTDKAVMGKKRKLWKIWPALKIGWTASRVHN
jgi:hypothetical protein